MTRNETKNQIKFDPKIKSHMKTFTNLTFLNRKEDKRSDRGMLIKRYWLLLEINKTKGNKLISE